jgi:hypothetical protein
MESQVYIRATTGFFVKGRGEGGKAGIVNPDETVLLIKSEAQDVIAANRGIQITQKEYQDGPQADFKPKDAENRLREQAETAARASFQHGFMAAAAQAPASRQQPSGKGA